MTDNWLWLLRLWRQCGSKRSLNCNVRSETPSNTIDGQLRWSLNGIAGSMLRRTIEMDDDQSISMAIAERNLSKHLIGPLVITAATLLVIDHLAHFRFSDFLLLSMIIVMLFVRPV